MPAGVGEGAGTLRPGLRVPLTGSRPDLRLRGALRSGYSGPRRCRIGPLKKSRPIRRLQVERGLEERTLPGLSGAGCLAGATLGQCDKRG